MQKEEQKCAQESLKNVTRVVANLTPTQVNEFYQSPDPNIFFPRVGLFVADFALGTILNQK